MVLDTDASFSISRLAEQAQHLLRKQSSSTLHPDNEHVDDILLPALEHVHIFRPQSLASTTATLRSLPDYLFNASRHHSLDRQVAFIALDSASAFYWQDKADTEDAPLLTVTTAGMKQQGGSTGYTALSAALKSACATFSCPAIFTSWHLGIVPAPQHASQHRVRSLRPNLPVPFSQLPTLRLITQRVPVKKFPAGTSAEEALREAPDRQKAVEEGSFVCVVNEWGVDERTLQRLQRVGSGFGFGISAEGLTMEDDVVGGDEH